MVAARLLLAAVLALGPGGLACSTLPLEEPQPPRVTPAPVEVAHLAVHVYQLVLPPETPEDEWDYHHTPGYTAGLRRRFQTELQQAGYTVILDRATPADVVATLQSDMPHDLPGVATLVLTRDRRVVDRLSVPVSVSGESPRTVHHVGEAAVRLVEAMGRSAAVAAVARDVMAHRQVGAGSPPQSIAGD